jgi:hypothetical protein
MVSNHMRNPRQSGQATETRRKRRLPRSSLPIGRRWGIFGAKLSGFIGGLVGLVAGLFTYPATAWFAVFELGIPSAIAGGLIGFASGTIASVARRG